VRKQNVFDDLGFSPDVAAALHMKSVLHSKIVNYVRVHYSQRQLQELLGEPQPRISDLLRGKISKFSLETLINYADVLHMQPELKTHRPVAMLQALKTCP
jgi:predicted XRE-type DNA-binding protein